MQHQQSQSASPKATQDHLRPDDLGLGPLFWTSRDAIIVAGKEGQILFWNPAAERLYGYTAEEVVGQSFDRIIPEHVREDIRALAEAYTPNQPGETPGSSAPIEMPSVHKSGEPLFVEFSVSTFPVGEETYGFAIVRDCTERKRLEAERDTLLTNAQETVRKAEDLAQLKADLSTLIAHELGNPLGAIGAMLELLDRDDLASDQRSQLLSSMRGEIQLLQRLVEDIRAAASMERGEFAIHPEPVDIKTILDEAMMSAQAQLADHDFSLETPPDAIVLADRERVGQILRNLLSNAAKYTPAGTRVSLRATRVDGRIRIDVEDEGPGIKPDDLVHIFTKFGRGRDASGHRIPGMGLGLFLSRQLARQHGGNLTASSKYGEGAIFSFDLKEAS